MNTVPAVQNQKLATVRGLLEKMRPQILMLLAEPRHVDSIIRVAMTEVQRNPDLLDCDQRSLLGAVMQAAQLGIEPDGIRGLAHLVAFKGRVTLIPGYAGLMYLALQSEGVQDIFARLVYEKDEFDVDYGADTLMHRPYRGADRGEVIAGYNMIVFENGYRRYGGGKGGGVMWRDEIDEIKARALANKRDPSNRDLPWNRDFEAMVWKTQIRRAGKSLPKNSRLATAVALDERAEMGLPQDLELLADPNAVGDGKGDGATQPTRAPRKSDKEKPEAKAGGDTQPQAPERSTASAAGTAQDSGSAATPAEPAAQSAAPPSAPSPAAEPSEPIQEQLPIADNAGAKISEATLDRLVNMMISLDSSKGAKVALTTMQERYVDKVGQPIGSVSRLTERQASDFCEWIGAILDVPAEGWDGNK